jgi:hypothetical protein
LHENEEEIFTVSDSLNDKERIVSNLIRGELGGRAAITKIEQDVSSERIEIHVVSPPNWFPWTAQTLFERCQMAVEATGCEIDVTLTASWGPQRAVA